MKNKKTYTSGGARKRDDPVLSLSPLLPKESDLLTAYRSGISSRSLDSLPSSPTDRNRVRADFLRLLLVGDGNFLLARHSLELSGAWIDGDLNLESSKIGVSCCFFNCHFDQTPNFTDAGISGVAIFQACEFPGFRAMRFSCSGALSFQNSTFSSNLDLRGARIGNDLNCEGVSVQRIMADAISVSGNACLCGLQVLNGICIRGARVNGILDCSKATLCGGDEPAVQAHGAVIEQDVVLEPGFKAMGPLDFSAAKIGGSLRAARADCDGKGKPAIFAHGIVVNGGIYLNRATLRGELKLLRCDVGLELHLVGATIENENGKAFSADGGSVQGSVSMKSAVLRGEVRLMAMSIEGNLAFQGANIASTTGCAIAGDRAVIKGNVYLSEGFQSVGTIRLSSMHVGGSLAICDSATLENEAGDSIFAQGLTVEHAFLFRNLTKAVDRVVLTSARVGRLVDDEAAWGSFLLLDGFVYQSISGGAPVNARMRLRWLDQQRPGHAAKNGRGKEFKPQPWRQLRRALLDMGYFEDARQVAIGYEKRLRTAGLVGQVPEHWPFILAIISKASARVAHWSFGVLIGYGYRPLRLVMWMAGMWLLCGLFYWYAALQGVMAPSNPLVFQNDRYSACNLSVSQSGNPKSNQRTPATTVRVESEGAKEINWYLCDALPEEYTGFSPLAYSLDVILPLVDLQQEHDWAPKVPTPKASWLEELLSRDLKHAVRIALWAEVIFGWVASLLLVAVVSGLTKRAEE